MTKFYESHANWPTVRIVDQLPDPVDPPGGEDDWKAGSVYLKDDVVNYLENTYKAKWWTKGDKPTDGGV